LNQKGEIANVSFVRCALDDAYPTQLQIDTEIENIKDDTRRLTTESQKLSEVKANRNDLASMQELCDHAVKSATDNSKSADNMTETISKFISNVEDRLLHKADIVDMNEKLGRIECDEFLQGLGMRLGAEIQKIARQSGGIREELDFVLSNLLQREVQASGVRQCLSCTKHIPSLHKPGAVPQTNRA